jgi:carbon storage regulator
MRLMLMISRRIGERIVIGQDIEITITEIHRTNVRIAVKAGSQQILRGEVHDAIERANRLAVASVIDDAAIAALSGPLDAPAEGGSSTANGAVSGSGAERSPKTREDDAR